MTHRGFAVPFTHRFLTTGDILGEDREQLSRLFESSGDVLPRVQCWIDGDVARACPTLPDAFEGFLQTLGGRPGRIRAAGVHLCIGGEPVKNDWAHVERMLDRINAADLDRRSYIVVVGGGAVLDAVGFAAATAHRGIRLIRIPTTTLAQADSGVGVKNAVNRFGKKNWLGTFAVPWAVINDTAMLSTLPDSHYRAGFSEAVKVTALKSPESFDELERSAAAIRRRELTSSSRAIRTSAELHLGHITGGGDPFEALEARPLDYGHWSAHRLEAMTNFVLPHGEAVSIGVAIDTFYSSLVCGLPERDARRIVRTLLELGIPIDHEALSRPDELFEGLEEFRQHLGGRLTLTMLRGIGDPIEIHEVDRRAMLRAIRLVRESAPAFERAA